MMRDLFETLIGDPAALRDIAQKRDDVVLALRATKTSEQDGIVGNG